jgi:hypothetical protein
VANRLEEDLGFKVQRFKGRSGRQKSKGKGQKLKDLGKKLYSVRSFEF